MRFKDFQKQGLDAKLEFYGGSIPIHTVEHKHSPQTFNKSDVKDR